MSREALGEGEPAEAAGRLGPVVDLDVEPAVPRRARPVLRRPALSRRAVSAAVVAALVLAGGTGGWLLHRRGQLARERRADAVLALTAAPGTATSDPSGVLVQVVLRNGGPRPVEVLGVGVDLPGVYVRAIDPRPAVVGAGASAAVTVHAVVDCARSGSDQPAAAAPLEVRARTADGRTQTLTLPGAAGEQAWSALFGGLGCGSGGSQLGLALAGPPAPSGDRLRVPLLLTGGDRALRVLSLRPQLGRTDQTTPPLPVDLPAHRGVHLELVVGPPRCDLLARDEQPADGLRVTFADAAGPSADRPAATQVLLPLGPDYARALAAAVRAACPP